MKIFDPKEFNFTESLGLILILSIIVSAFVGFVAGSFGSSFFGLNDAVPSPMVTVNSYQQQEAVVKIVEDYSQAVVSIIVSKDVPVLEDCYINPFEDSPFFNDPFFQQFYGDIRVPSQCQRGFEHKEVGGGSGFTISEDGLILTNKHVVLDKNASYTVITNNGEQYDAEILAQDPLRDLAVLKIDANSMPVVKLGDSDNIKVGQTVVAIGNALGEFRNTVSVGIVSGLSRTITASGPGITEELRDIIQTDAAINQGNSGGPLLNIRGEVIGVNTAIAESAQNIGFAIPVNDAKKAVESVKESGRIIYPFLGVRFVTLTDSIAEENNLPVKEGAWLRGESGSSPIVGGSPAEEAGLKSGDIITEAGGYKITVKETLADLLQQYNVGETVTLKVLRFSNNINDWRELELQAILIERDF